MATNPLSRLLRLFRNPKFQILAVMTASVVVCLVAREQPRAILQLLVAIITALLAQWAFFGKVGAASLQSAAITGMLVGMLLAPGAGLVIVWLAVVVAIASKKLAQFKQGKHIFNPAAFGLVFASLILGNRLNWWGYMSPVLVIALAGAIMFRLHRLSLPFSYFLSRGLSAMAAGAAGIGLNAFLLPNLFFGFIMLVEPKTSPAKRPAQVLFGILCGVLATVFYGILPSLDGDLSALLVVNLLRPVLARVVERI